MPEPEKSSDAFSQNKTDLEKIQERLARHKLRAAELNAKAQAQGAKAQEQSSEIEAKREDFLRRKASNSAADANDKS